MINLNKMWKSIEIYKRTKREIKEVRLENININEYLIIDVRSRREFSETHLNGALNIPLSEIKRNIGKYVQNNKKKILLCCQSGIRSKRATEILGDLGYVEVYNLKGGLENI